MSQSYAYYKELLAGFIQDSLTEEQSRELYAFIGQYPELYERMMNEPQIEALVQESAGHSEAELATGADDRIREHILAYTRGEGVDMLDVGGRVVPGNWKRRPFMGWRAIAAAVVLMAVITTAILTTMHQRANRVQQVANAIPAPQDIAAPVNNRAVITLADGRNVPLDSLQKGVLAAQSTVKVVKLQDGQIEYERGPEETDQRMVYNTLTNPRGSKVVDIGLSDGSHVWLNAGSSLTYPVAFTGGERKVSVNGEAYFEITADASKPFVVNKGGVAITVLGTHFDVDAYGDASQEIKTTLLEGAVRVRKGMQQTTLRPGQQAQVSAMINVISNVNVNQVMAWKNGFFNFENMRLPEVMQQLERWYNITVVYEGGVPDVRFFGELRRDMNLSGIMAALHDSGVQFRLEGNRLIVLP